MKTQRKIQKEFTYEGLGFPVVLEDVPMIRIRGEWTPDINYNALEEAMAIAVAFKAGRMTGNEVRFIRLHLGLTLQAFARLFGLTRQAVMKWEKSENEPTSMNWSTDKDIRLYLLARSKDRAISLDAAYGKIGERLREKQNRGMRFQTKFISRPKAFLNSCFAG